MIFGVLRHVLSKDGAEEEGKHASVRAIGGPSECEYTHTHTNSTPVITLTPSDGGDLTVAFTY